MQRRLLILGSLFMLSFHAQSQVLFSESKDTAVYHANIGGASDTMDISLNKAVSLLPGIGFNNHFNYANFYWFYGDLQRLGISPLNNNRTFTFSALPHLGFAYSFGSKGFQNIHVNYAQGFKKGGLLNIHLERQSSNAFVRNGNFMNSNLWMGYTKDKGKVWTQIKFNYQSDNRTLNGGSSDTVNFVLFGAEYARINKSLSSSKSRLAEVLVENRLNFTGDSSLVKTGLLVQHKLGIHNREYLEQDTLYGIYSTINIDSNFTRDQFQENSLANGAGYFFQTGRFEVNGQLFHRLRKLQNLGVNRDTNEIALDGAARFAWNGLEMTGYLYQNLVGAKGESRYQAKARYKRGNLKASVEMRYDRILPNMVQRQYFANNLNYTTALQLQQNFISTGFLEYRVNDFFIARGQGGYVDRKDALVWNGTQWTRNALSNDRCGFIRVEPQINFRNFVLYPFVEYTYGSQYLPEWVEGGRLLLKKRVFKQQKLLLTLAADLIYSSQYTTMAYSTLMDAYVIGGNLSESMMSVHSTFGLTIQEFRFYFRLENLNRLGLFQGNNPNNLVDGYFASPFALKVGITWDFFN
ncbi:MAG: hypothetical protein N4A41_09485 [Crocinitomicaceae bacterium]|jgi:hypothetical protein|nr:hypothetical protein [Crocinitomicaceae bacterium]